MNKYSLQFIILLKLDLYEFFRTRMVLFSSALMPVIMTLSYALGMNNSYMDQDNYFEYIFPAILSVGTMFSAMYSSGYVIILDQQKNIICELLISPVGLPLYYLCRLCGILIKSAFQIVICLLIALPFYNYLYTFNPIILIINYILIGVCYSSLGMLIGYKSNVLSYPGLANIILLPSLYFCGVFFPIEYYDEFSSVISLLPPALSVDLMRAGLLGESENIFSNISILAFYAVAISVSFYIYFRVMILRSRTC